MGICFAHKVKTSVFHTHSQVERLKKQRITLEISFGKINILRRFIKYLGYWINSGLFVVGLKNNYKTLNLSGVKL